MMKSPDADQCEVVEVGRKSGVIGIPGRTNEAMDIWMGRGKEGRGIGRVMG